MESEKLQILIDVLARTDALWAVPRVHSDPATCLPQPSWQAVLERRADFQAAGVEYRIGGDAAERKAGERLLGEMQTWGLLVIAFAGGRRCGVRLTASGDDLARYFAASTMLHEAWGLLAAIDKLVVAGVHRNRWVREDDLARVDYGAEGSSPKLVRLADDLLPLKARGLVDDTADAQGRVWYAITPTGKATVKGKAPREPKDLPEYSGEWCDIHTRLVEQYEAERLFWTPTRTNNVVVPMSCGVSPKKSWREAKAKR